MTGTNIAEITRRHSETDLTAVGRCRGLKVTGKVVNHLGQQTGPIDGIDGADLVAALELKIVRNRFNNVLAIVKNAFNGDVVNVFVHQAEHLGLLKRAHATIWRSHENSHAFFAPHGVLSRASGVAAGGAQDVEHFVSASQLVLEQVAQQLHRHVFERQCRPVGKRFEVKAFLEFFQGHDLWRVENCGCVGLATQSPQICRRNIVDVKR